MSIKTIGILGGYGNNATIHFQEILRNIMNDNKITRHHYKTIVINDSLLYDPDGIDTINLSTIDEEQILKQNIEYVKKLENLNISVLVSPCNTYSKLFSKITSKINILNIVTETSNYVNKLKIDKVGLLCTSKTYRAGLYNNLIKPSVFVLEECLDDINIIIRLSMFGYYRVNNKIPSSLLKQLNIGDDINLLECFNSVIDKYRRKGINYIILGCTELPLFVNKNTIRYKDIEFIDSCKILAESALH